MKDVRENELFSLRLDQSACEPYGRNAALFNVTARCAYNHHWPIELSDSLVFFQYVFITQKLCSMLYNVRREYFIYRTFRNLATPI
jgi:hypothetical protein